MYAHINETRIFFDVEGVGAAIDDNQVTEKEPCFILHGGPGSNHLSYKSTLSPLTRFMQLIYVDNRGSGFSDDSAPENYNMEQNVDDLEALRKYLGLGKITLFGQSYGGMVAMRYATKYPKSIKALLLVTTSPHFSFIEDARKELKERGTAEQNEIAEVLWAGEFETEDQHIKFQQLLAPMYAYTYDESAPKTKGLGKYSFEALNQGFGGFLRQYDVTEEIKKIDIPTLIVGAKHDWITPVKHSYWMSELIKDSKLIILEKSSHSVLKDEKDKFLSLVVEFIKKEIVKV